MLRFVFSAAQEQSADFCQASGHPLQQHWIPDLSKKFLIFTNQVSIGYSIGEASKPTGTTPPSIHP